MILFEFKFNKGKIQSEFCAKQKLAKLLEALLQVFRSENRQDLNSDFLRTLFRITI